jgi:DNA-binding protein Fis
MKKKIISLVALLMMFMGVISASSINGDYKGNPIVKVMSNGKQLEVDEVPAMIYDGHTVVPISTLRQLGASVTWDAYGYSVDVRFPTNEQPIPQTPGHTGNNDIATLKAYSSAAEIYRQLINVGDSMDSVSQAIINYGNKLNGKDSGIYNGLAENDFAVANDLLNMTMSNNNDAYNSLLASGVNIHQDVKGIVFSYGSALNTYRDSLNGLKEHDDKKFHDNWDNALKSLSSSRSKSADKYFEWYNKVQNY